MYITENQSIGDSVLFLMAARASLSNIIEEGNTKNGAELISFIQNEASDYQVMNLLLYGTLPEEKYNAVAEAILFSDLKESMLMNKDFVTEMVGENIFDNVLNEVDSLYMATSTQRPVLEFESQTDPIISISCMISEALPPGMGTATGKQAIMAKIATLKSQAAAASGAAKAAILKKLAAAKAQAAAYMNSAKATAAYKGGAAKTAIAKKVAAGKSALASKVAAGKSALASKVAAGKSAVSGSLSKATAGAGKAGTAVGKFATTKAGLATGGAAAGALALYAGYKIYKRFFSQAAKACAGQSGAAKSACMNKYKKAAIMKQASAIQSASGTCAKSKDPAKCKAAVGKKVAALKAKAAKIAA